MSESYSQFEVEFLAWTNLGLTLFSLPLFAFYTCTTLDGVDDYGKFITNDPRGAEMVEILLKLGVFLILWVPMSILLKVAASKRNASLLKLWNVFQVILIFMVSLHLLVQPPTTLIMVFAYALSFLYFLISLWICEKFIKEIKGSEVAKFGRMSVEVEVPSPLVFDNNFNFMSTESTNPAEVYEYQNIQNNSNDILAIQMKKVIPKTSL